MTLTLFNRLYEHYKDDWDYEMILRSGRITYSEAYEKAQKAEEWF